MLTLIKNGDVYAPAPLGRTSVLLVDGKIGRVGRINQEAVEALDLEEHGFELDQLLPFFTSNTAGILQLRSKGSLEPGKVGDLLVLQPETFELVEVIAGGRRMVSNGDLQISEAFLQRSEREIELHGQKT